MLSVIFKYNNFKKKYFINEGYTILEVARKYNISNSYELLKKVTRGQMVSKDILHNLIKSLEIPKSEKDKLLKLKPENYIGYAIDLCNDKK